MCGIVILFLFGFWKEKLGFGSDIVVIYYLCNTWVVNLQQKNITASLCCVEWTVQCIPDFDAVVNKLWCHAHQRQQVSNVIAFYNVYAKLSFGHVLKRSLSAHWMQVKLFCHF